MFFLNHDESGKLSVDNSTYKRFFMAVEQNVSLQIQGTNIDNNVDKDGFRTRRLNFAISYKDGGVGISLPLRHIKTLCILRTV
jgi:hypothetical protein